MTIGFQRHQRLHITVTLSYQRVMRDDQEQDVWVMMTDQDVIILSHGAVIYNLAMWTLSHVSSWDVGADVSSIGYIIIIW